MANNVLIIRVPEPKVPHLLELRDFIRASLDTGILVLPDDSTIEVMELPQLGRVDVRLIEPEAEAPPASDETLFREHDLTEGTEGAEKRVILQRLKDYRAAHGLGSLEAVSAKTAYFRDKRLTAEELRMILVGDGPPRPIDDWRKIGRALAALEKSEEGGVNPERRPE